MSHVKNAAVCLLDDKVSYNDIGPESGLVDAYFNDADRPFLDNHMFLMYDPRSNGKYASSAMCRMKNLDSFYNSRVIYVHRKPYFVYTYTMSPAIKYLKNGVVHCSKKEKLRMIDFWKWNDPWIVNNVLSGTKVIDKDDSILPLDDGNFDYEEDVLTAA